MHPVVRAILQSGSDNKTYLYNQGDECTALTGGWVGGYQAASLNITKGASTIAVTLPTTAPTGTTYQAAIETSNYIDLNNYTTLNFNVTSVTNVDGGRFVCLSTSSSKASTVYTGSAADFANFNTTGVKTIDISALNGNYYIRAGIYRESTTNPLLSITFDKAWLV
jgi:hypothetical protein